MFLFASLIELIRKMKNRISENESIGKGTTSGASASSIDDVDI